jgi:hypothetical protein
MFSAGCTMNIGSKKLLREVASTFCGAHRLRGKGALSFASGSRIWSTICVADSQAFKECEIILAAVRIQGSRSPTLSSQGRTTIFPPTLFSSIA